MAIHLLTARQVQAAGNGDQSDGGGLVLKVHKGRARWPFRFTSPIDAKASERVRAREVLEEKKVRFKA